MIEARNRSLTALVVGGVVLVGCGGDDDASLGRTVLADKANAICRAAQPRVAAVSVPADVSDVAQLSAYLDALVPIVGDQLEQIAALNPADEVKRDFQAFVEVAGRAVTAVKSIRAKARNRDPSAVQDLRRVEALTRAVTKRLDGSASPTARTDPPSSSD